ncbi:MAG: hypothetical protein R3C69_11385 [Geminicoccaceae bacterium]
MLRGIGDDFVLVNIAGPTYVYKNWRPRLADPIGQQYRRAPSSGTRSRPTWSSTHLDPCPARSSSRTSCR